MGLAHGAGERAGKKSGFLSATSSAAETPSALRKHLDFVFAKKKKKGKKKTVRTGASRPCEPSERERGNVFTVCERDRMFFFIGGADKEKGRAHPSTLGDLVAKGGEFAASRSFHDGV